MDRTAGRGRQAAGLTQHLEDRRASTSVLILFSATGGGHRAAARALASALYQIDPNAQVDLFDPLVGQGPLVTSRLASLYPVIIQRARPAWGAIYHSTNYRSTFGILLTAFGRGVRRQITQRIAERDPDLIISVHPLLNHVTREAISRAGRNRPLVTVVTDLLDLHRGWACPSADMVVVPSEDASRAVVRRGVPAQRVQLLGLPVDLRFRPPAPGERHALRRRFGLDQDRPTLLVTSGGEGSGGLPHQVKALAAEDHPWQVIVVCGRNQRLRERLASTRFPTPTMVLGFVETMPELMRASDLVVSKAGPGAIAEALATELPLILTSYLPGQETPNVRFVTESGIGVYTPRSEELRRTVERLLGPDRRELQAMVEKAAAIARPYASLDIARHCLELVERYRSSAEAVAAPRPSTRFRRFGRG